jgi:hypothetical protein
LSSTTAEIVFLANDGTRVRMTLQLSQMLRAGDPRVASTFSGEPPCQADSQRDAVFVGTVSFTNETPDFSAPIYVKMYANNDTQFGVVYSSGPRCSGSVDIAYSYVGSILSPSMEEPRWGPAKVEIVLKNIFSPAHPDGDISAVSYAKPFLLAVSTNTTYPAAKFYDFESVSGPVGEPKTRAISDGYKSVPLQLEDLIAQ